MTAKSKTTSATCDKPIHNDATQTQGSEVWFTALLFQTSDVRKIRFQYVPHMLARDFRHLPMYPMSMPAKWQRPRDYAKWDHKDPCQCRSRQLPKSSRLGKESPRGMRELMDCVLWVSCTWCLHGMLCDMPVNGMEILYNIYTMCVCVSSIMEAVSPSILLYQFGRTANRMSRKGHAGSEGS